MALAFEAAGETPTMNQLREAGIVALVRGTVLVIVGVLTVASAGCTSGCLFLVNVEAATHPQSPIRSWPLAPRGELHERLEVDLSAWPSPGVEVEVALYEEPFKATPIACKVHVAAATKTGTVDRRDEAPISRPSRCSVGVEAAGPTHLSVEAANLSDRAVTVSVTPALPGFDRRIKAVWAVLGLLALAGLALTALGGVRWARGDGAPT